MEEEFEIYADEDYMSDGHFFWCQYRGVLDKRKLLEACPMSVDEKIINNLEYVENELAKYAIENVASDEGWTQPC